MSNVGEYWAVMSPCARGAIIFGLVEAAADWHSQIAGGDASHSDARSFASRSDRPVLESYLLWQTAESSSLASCGLSHFPHPSSIESAPIRPLFHFLWQSLKS
jgi:hypothetical protein